MEPATSQENAVPEMSIAEVLDACREMAPRDREKFLDGFWEKVTEPIREMLAGMDRGADCPEAKWRAIVERGNPTRAEIEDFFGYGAQAQATLDHYGIKTPRGAGTVLSVIYGKSDAGPVHRNVVLFKAFDPLSEGEIDKAIIYLLDEKKIFWTGSGYAMTDSGKEAVESGWAEKW
jgi:hypothetical protein